MDGLSIKNPIKMDDLGVPLFLETPISKLSPLEDEGHEGLVGDTPWSFERVLKRKRQDLEEFVFFWERCSSQIGKKHILSCLFVDKLLELH